MVFVNGVLVGGASGSTWTADAVVQQSAVSTLAVVLSQPAAGDQTYTWTGGASELILNENGGTRYRFGTLASQGALRLVTTNPTMIWGNGDGNTQIRLAAITQLSLENSNPANAGVGLDFGTDGLLKIRSRLQAADADLSCSTLSSTFLGVAKINFTPAASTFANTATITNGPRAANPIAWVEVQVNGSSGRIPVW